MSEPGEISRESERRTRSRPVSGPTHVEPRADLAIGAPIFLAGPTAVGKSEIALLLAEKIGGEIMSVDSMQVYRGLDIGTAKPSAAERARVPHHLIDVVDLKEPFDAAKFVALARKVVAEIQSRHRVPIFCGGTGLYFKAFLDGLGDAPPSDQKLRALLEATPFADLLRELKERDPKTFEMIDSQNPRRVIRAVEVIRLTGKPFCAQRAPWVEPDLGTPALPGCRSPVVRHPSNSFCFTRSPADLHARINARVDTMFARGLVDETRRLLEHNLAQNKTALQAIGYRQVVEHLLGERSLPETIELVKIKTRQFAKRQKTWFRRQLNLEWIELEPEAAPENTAAILKTRMNSQRD
jgi:tRNA dimethylallyltransferase